jgi:acyl carrier protein
MVSADLEKKLRKIVADHLDVEEDRIMSNSSFIDDLGADSLGLVELIMALEDEFGLEIPDEDAEKILTVGDALTYLQKHIAS